MRGYPQFSFWISIAPDMIYLSQIVTVTLFLFNVIIDFFQNTLQQANKDSTIKHSIKFSSFRLSLFLKVKQGQDFGLFCFDYFVTLLQHGPS